ncbi:hypothetical protein BH24ACT15_BH24ACT15_32440 [soil metagenome]
MNGIKSALNSRQVKDKAKELGADLVGIIDTETINAQVPAPTAPQTTDRIDPRYVTCIILAKRMPVGEFLSDNRMAVAHTNQAICRYLERVAYRLSFWLEEQGVPSLQVVMDETDPALKKGSYGYLSYRHIAVEAGLGTFGLEANLLTPEFGPRVYLTGVLTTAVLESDRRITEQLCIGPACGRCLQACPTDAIHQWTLDKRLCALMAQVHGVSSILKGPVKSLLADPSAVHTVLDDPQQHEKFDAITRVTEAFGVCPRCLETCPVGMDYQQYLAKEHRHIPEETEQKTERLKLMKEAEKRGEVVVDNPPINRRHVGPEGYVRLRRGDSDEIRRLPLYDPVAAGANAGPDGPGSSR